jgi:hypothetical protein
MNHTITFQMQPSYHPKGQYGDSNIASHAIPQTWNKNGKCPNNTIPIRRIKEEDVLRAGSINLYGKKRPESIPNIHPPVSNVTSGHQVCRNIVQKKITFILLLAHLPLGFLLKKIAAFSFFFSH